MVKPALAEACGTDAVHGDRTGTVCSVTDWASNHLDRAQTVRQC
jgi:hypothetical protein